MHCAEYALLCKTAGRSGSHYTDGKGFYNNKPKQSVRLKVKLLSAPSAMFPPPTPAQQEKAAFCEYAYSTRLFLVNMPPRVFGVATLDDAIECTRNALFWCWAHMDKETRKLYQSQVIVALDLLTSIRYLHRRFYPDQRISAAMPNITEGERVPLSTFTKKEFFVAERF